MSLSTRHHRRPHAIERAQGVRGGQGGPGAYRTVQNFVANSRTREIIYTPPPPEDVAPLMRDLVDWLRTDSAIHPVLVAGIAQFQLVHIHPFLDGTAVGAGIYTPKIS
jgi:Fic family protein